MLQVQNAKAFMGALKTLSKIPNKFGIRIASNGSTTIAAWDLDTRAIVSFPCETSQNAWETSFDAKAIGGLKVSKGTTLAIGSDGAIHVDGAIHTLPTLAPDADRDPSLDAPETTAHMATTVAGLRHVLENTSYCASTDNTRYYLNGVLLETDAYTLRCVATDGHRMAIRETSADRYGEIPQGFILPIPAVRATLALLKGMDGATPVKLGFTVDAKTIVISFGSATIVARRVDGEFPDWRQVIGSSADPKIAIVRDVPRCAKMIDAFKGAHRMTMKASALDTVLALFIGADGPMGSAALPIEIDTLAVERHGRTIDCVISPAYMLEALEYSDGPVYVAMRDDRSPMHLYTDGQTDPIAVIMPMQR